MKQANKDSQPLILRLIQADMRNFKLVVDTSKPGARMEDFETNLARVIFQQIGFVESDDELHSIYYDFLNQKAALEAKEYLKLLQMHSNELYEILLVEKERREPLKDMYVKAKHKPLEELFDYVSQEEMRRSVNKMFFTWLAENNDIPKDIRRTAENIGFLVQFLEGSNEL